MSEDLIKACIRRALLESSDWTGSWGADCSDVIDSLVDDIAEELHENEIHVVTEHATRYKSGDHKIRCNEPEVEEIYPLAQWIVHQQGFGGKVYRRRVIVVDDWEEVPKAGSGGVEVDG